MDSSETSASVGPAPGSAPGDLIDGYKIVDYLGQGGMGWVYQVEHPESGKPLALKILRQQAGASNLDRIRFEREFKLTSQLKHPGLVGVHAFGVHADQPYYTMDLVEGQHFRDYVQRTLRKLEPREFFERFDELCQQLLEVLYYIHSQGIVHRDLKPENILVDVRGWPRLLDFGLARTREVSQNVTVPGTILGTFAYMPPEQITNGEIDERSDLYSFAVMVYEALAGRSPFQATAVPAIFYEILDGTPPLLDEVAGPLPMGLSQLVARLLSKEPAERPYSARQLLQLWRPIFSGLVLPAQQGTRPHTLQSPRLVGRGVELALISQALADCQQGKGGMLAFEGASGLGKTRLLQEASTMARVLDLPTTSSCGQELEDLPYQLWLGALRASLSPSLTEKYRSVLALVLPDLGDVARATELSGIHKLRLFDAMCQVLGSRPQVLLLEDLEHADTASLEFLHFLVRSQAESAGASVLIVATLNGEREIPRALAALEQRGSLQRHQLQPLTEKGLDDLLSSMLDGSAIEELTLSRVFEETGGVPAFAVELFKLAFSEGRIRWENRPDQPTGAWSLGWAASTDSNSGLPLGFREILLRRFQDLGPTELEVARVAALISPRVEFGRLQQVSGLNGLELLDSLAVLLRRKLLQEGPPSRAGSAGAVLGSRDSYRFSSQLMVGVALEGLSAARRQELHLRVANSASNPAEQAYHYAQAERWDDALRLWTEAGDQALSSFAHADGARFYAEALKLPGCPPMLEERLADALFQMGHLDEAGQRYSTLLEGRELSPSVRAALLNKLGFVFDRQGELEQAYACLLQALALLGISVGSHALVHRIGVVARVTSTQFFPVIWSRPSAEDAPLIEASLQRLARVVFFLRPRSWALTSADITARQHDLARADGRKEGRSHALQMWALMWMGIGFYSRARRALQRSIEEAARSDSSRFRALILRDSGLCLFMAGDQSGGIAALQRSLQESESVADIHYLPQTLLMLSMVYCIGGELELAEQSVARVSDNPELWTSPADMVLCQINFGMLRVAQNRLFEAEEHLTNAEFLQGDRKVSLLEAFLLLLKASLLTARLEAGGGGELLEALRLARQLRKMGDLLRVLTYIGLQAQALEATALVLLSERAGRASAEATRAVAQLQRATRQLFPLLHERAAELSTRLLGVGNK